MTINTRTWIRTTASLFLTVFVVYYAIISAYAHVHVVNGVMVVHSLEASGSQLVCSPFQPVFLIDYTEHVPTCLLPEFESGVGLRAPPYSSFHLV